MAEATSPNPDPEYQRGIYTASGLPDSPQVDSDKKTRGEERDELKRTIKELQDEVVSLKRSIRETADYFDGKFEKALKVRKLRVYIEEEPIEEKFVLKHG
ncbi:MAG: hypothetical protein M1840_003238, partial [Geoglossum simile]